MNWVLALPITLVVGKTFVGKASEFSSSGFGEVSWMTVAAGATDCTPLMLRVAPNAEPETLTALTMTSPDAGIRLADTKREAFEFETTAGRTTVPRFKLNICWT